MSFSGCFLKNRLSISTALVICLLFLDTAAYGINTNFDCLQFRDGLRLLQKTDYLGAAEMWSAASEGLLKKARNSEGLRTAGFLEVLAAIAFEKAKDSRTYAFWELAVGHFAEAGSSWKEVRALWNKDLAETHVGFRTTQTGFEASGSFSGAVLCLDLEKELSVSSYSGPADVSGKQEQPLTNNGRGSASKSYFPKPFLLQQEERSRNQAVEQKPRLNEENSDSGSLSSTYMNKGISKEEPARKPDASLSVLPPAGFAPMPTTSKELGGGIAKLSHTKKGSNGQESFRNSAISGLPLDQKDMAAKAWQYFVQNYEPKTGLVNSVENYPYATIWDIGSTVAAFVAAEELQLINSDEFSRKMSLLIRTLQEIPLYNNELPNREYGVRTGQKIGLQNQPSLVGSGWSVLDVGRLLIWLYIVKSWYPEFSEMVVKTVERFKLDRACNSDGLYGVLFNGQREVVRQEGRLGYEQYAASGFALWNRLVPAAFKIEPVKWVQLYGENIPVDTRPYPFLTSEPFFLAKMEVGGVDDRFNSIIDTIYNVQKRRWQILGIPTAVSEDAVNLKPWFVYNCIYYQDIPWTCVDRNGRPYPELKNLSTKAAMAWSAVYSDNYSELLYQQVKKLASPDSAGFYAGLYESNPAKINTSRNINTNAIILESLLYLQRNKKPFIDFRLRN